MDEIADLSLPTQAALLRVLETNEITPVGTSTPRKVDVRVIAASNKDLAVEVDNDRFRYDLFMRLGVHLDLPPLRLRL